MGQNQGQLRAQRGPVGTYRAKQGASIDAKSLRKHRGWGDWGKATQQDASEGKPVGADLTRGVGGRNVLRCDSQWHREGEWVQLNHLSRTFAEAGQSRDKHGAPTWRLC